MNLKLLRSLRGIWSKESSNIFGYLPPDVSQERERAWPAVIGASVDDAVNCPSLATMIGRLGGTGKKFIFKFKTTFKFLLKFKKNQITKFKYRGNFYTFR